MRFRATQEHFRRSQREPMELQRVCGTFQVGPGYFQGFRGLWIISGGLRDASENFRGVPRGLRGAAADLKGAQLGSQRHFRGSQRASWRYLEVPAAFHGGSRRPLRCFKGSQGRSRRRSQGDSRVPEGHRNVSGGLWCTSRSLNGISGVSGTFLTIDTFLKSPKSF